MSVCFVIIPLIYLQLHYFLQKYSGSFSNVVRAANQSAVKLLDLVVTEFPSLRDTAEYNGQKSMNWL